MVIKDKTSDNVEAALEWMRAGCSVIPIRADGTKKPLIKWEPYQSRRATEAEIRQWFTGTEYGIGIVCGAISGNLELAELEGRATTGESFDKIQEAADVEFDNWDKWTSGHRTYAEHTPSGGIHLLYRIGDGVVPGNTKIANNAANECLAETRGEGGYVIVAPTGGKVHATGEDWKAINGCLPAGITTIPFSLRNELHSVLRQALDERPAPPPRTPKTESIRMANPGDETPADHFNRITSWAEILEPAGWIYHHHEGREDFWTRPGKDPHLGHSASTGYSDSGDRMYVWSSSSSLRAEEPMSKFFVWAELNHRGDLSTAAADLRRQGFGTNRPMVYEEESIEDWDWAMGPSNQVKRPEKAVAATESKEPTERRLIARPLSSYTMQRTKWLWEGRIPLGEITLLGGREGTGKSTILASWAADITNGTMKGEFYGTPRRVLYIAAEDSTEKTIFPRMVAAGADPDMISLVYVDPKCGQYGSPDFPGDCKEIERLIRETDSAVVMLDPLLSNISSKINVNQSKELRTALEPLRRVAERTECAIIGLAHLNKSTGSDVSSKFVGSRAFLEVARAVFSVGKAPKEQPEDEEQEFFAEQEFILDQEKNNLGPCNFPGITYKIVSAHLKATDGDDISTNLVIFTGETNVKVEDVLNGNAKTRSESIQAKVVALVKKGYAKANLLVSAQEIVDTLNASQGTVRSALSRAVTEGLLSCPQRGLYGPPGAMGGGLRESSNSY